MDSCVRLDGSRFPPFVVFKIFSKAQSVHYISGKNMLRVSTEVCNGNNNNVSF